MIPKHRQGNICRQGIYFIRQTHLARSTQGFRVNTAGGVGKAGNIPLAHLKMTLVQKRFSMKIFNGYRSTLSGTFKDLPAYFYNQHNNLHKNSSLPLSLSLHFTKKATTSLPAPSVRLCSSKHKRYTAEQIWKDTR